MQILVSLSIVCISWYAWVAWMLCQQALDREKKKEGKQKRKDNKFSWTSGLGFEPSTSGRKLTQQMERIGPFGIKLALNQDMRHLTQLVFVMSGIPYLVFWLTLLLGTSVCMYYSKPRMYPYWLTCIHGIYAWSITDKWCIHCSIQSETLQTNSVASRVCNILRLQQILLQLLNLSLETIIAIHTQW